MFAYCGNNPVNRVDSTGMFWQEVEEVLKEVVDVVVQTAIANRMPAGTYNTFRMLHYNRNVFNNSNYTEEELIKNKYKPELEDSDKFHQNNQLDGERNRKYVIGDWFSSELVYYSDGTINNTPEDMGTFNVYSGDNSALNIIVHGFFDVVPYMIWGNSSEDSTTIVDRIIMIWE
jgi:hypothetical protein